MIRLMKSINNKNKILIMINWNMNLQIVIKMLKRVKNNNIKENKLNNLNGHKNQLLFL